MAANNEDQLTDPPVGCYVLPVTVGWISKIHHFVVVVVVIGLRVWAGDAACSPIFGIRTSHTFIMICLLFVCWAVGTTPFRSFVD
jgi:hypothetical protein